MLKLRFLFLCCYICKGNKFTLFFGITNTVAALIALRLSLSEPNIVFQSWDKSFDNPFLWSRVTCNSESNVTHVDLQSANLSGTLVPQLGQLSKLQYLKLHCNNITGEIPEELGDLRELVSLDIYENNISGPVPSSLGNLDKLRYLRLYNNSLSGEIPRSLTAVPLQVLDISNNQLSGDIPVNGSFSQFASTSFANNNLRPRPASLPSPSGSQKAAAISGRVVTAAAIAGGVAAGSALLFVIAWWLKRKLWATFLMCLILQLKKS